MAKPLPHHPPLGVSPAPMTFSICCHIRDFIHMLSSACGFARPPLQSGGTDTWGNEVSSWDAFSIIASTLSHHYFRSLESERQFRAWLCGWNGRCNAALFVCFCQWIPLSILWCTLPAPCCMWQGIVCCAWYRVLFPLLRQHQHILMALPRLSAFLLINGSPQQILRREVR